VSTVAVGSPVTAYGHRTTVIRAEHIRQLELPLTGIARKQNGLRRCGTLVQDYFVIILLPLHSFEPWAEVVELADTPS
jgi:hypothetical protein